IIIPDFRRKVRYLVRRNIGWIRNNEIITPARGHRVESVSLVKPNPLCKSMASRILPRDYESGTRYIYRIDFGRRYLVCDRHRKTTAPRPEIQSAHRSSFATAVLEKLPGPLRQFLRFRPWDEDVAVDG